jgi:hypothetical protein
MGPLKLSSASDKKERNFLKSTLGGFFVVAFLEWIWPNFIPFSYFEFWVMPSMELWITPVLYLLGAGVVFATIMHIIRRSNPGEDPGELFLGGTVLSFFAGITEEIGFRWIIFYTSIAGIKISNFFFFGFLGFGVPEFMFTHVFGPLANLTTFGFLEPFLFHPQGWAVGAGLLSSNAFFRDGHTYQGPVGVVHSWFVGMFFFYALFNYGLPVAIIAHIAYDLMVFWYAALISVFKGARRRSPEPLFR